MSENEPKTPEEISQHLTDEKQKLEGSKLLSKIEDFHSDLKALAQSLQNDIRNLIINDTHQDEFNSKLLADVHQFAELLQKLDNTLQHTNKMVSQQEKEIKENRQLIHKLEKEIHKIKSVIRID